MSAIALGTSPLVLGHRSQKRANTVESGLALQCPACRANLDTRISPTFSRTPSAVLCTNCQFVLRQEGGIWNALPSHRQEYFSRFIREYEIVRASEGRGSEHPSFYLALPYKDLTGRNQWQWNIRSQSFQYIQRKILSDVEQRLHRPFAILDLGAGNGWLSYRLAVRGHFPVAVDLLTNEFDGLSAAFHYSSVLTKVFPLFRAELDSLPFADRQFDCIVFNASFHYSEDYQHTLGEALRCLRSDGIIVIVDTPWYSREEFGQQMIQERRQDFSRRFGFPSNALASLEYLTDKRLTALAEQFGIRWRIHRAWYGLRWAMRPWLAKWTGRREPAEFRIYTTELGTP